MLSMLWLGRATVAGARLSRWGATLGRVGVVGRACAGAWVVSRVLGGASLHARQRACTGAASGDCKHGSELISHPQAAASGRAGRLHNTQPGT